MPAGSPNQRGQDSLVARHELWNYLENRAPQGRPGAAAREAQLQAGATRGKQQPRGRRKTPV